jgi:hypothetical protein
MNVRLRMGAFAVLLIALSVGATACSSSEDVSGVDDVWSRTSASMADAAAVYLTISGATSETHSPALPLTRRSQGWLNSTKR